MISMIQDYYAMPLKVLGSVNHTDIHTKTFGDTQ